MTKEKAIKYDGDWIQVATHDMDQVFLYAGKLFEFCLKILVEYGMGWALRKIAGLMTVQLSLEAQEDGIISTLKTRIKSNKVLNLYEFSPTSSPVKSYSSPISSSSEQFEARTIIAQVHSGMYESSTQKKTFFAPLSCLVSSG